MKTLNTIFILLLLLAPYFSYCADLEQTVSDAFEMYSVGSYGESAPMFEEAYYMVKKNSARDISARFRTALYAGLSYRGLGDYAKAGAWFGAALALAEKSDDLYDIPALIAYYAESLRMTGKSSKAGALYQQALSYTDLQDKDKAVLYYGLAESKRLDGDYKLSKHNCDEALKYAEPLSIYKIEMSCDIITGEYYRAAGDYAKAMFYFGRAADTSRARKHIEVFIPALNGMGLTSEALHRHDAAREYFEQALFAAIENGSLDTTDIIADKIFSYMPNKGNLKYQGDKAAELAKLDFLDNETVLLLYRLACSYYGASKLYTELYGAGEGGYAAANKLSDNKNASKFLYDMAFALYNLGEYEESVSRADEAIARAGASKRKDLNHQLYFIKAESLFKTGEYKKSYDAMQKAASYAKLSEHDKIMERLSEIKSMIEKAGDAR